MAGQIFAGPFAGHFEVVGGGEDEEGPSLGNNGGYGINYSRINACGS